MTITEEMHIDCPPAIAFDSMAGRRQQIVPQAALEPTNRVVVARTPARSP